MRRLIIALALATSAAAPANALAQFPADSTILRIIKDRVDTKRSTGIVVGLIENGRTRVIAYNERAHGEPAFDENTIFEIGSISKAFTGALLADMVARAEVKLEDPVSLYLPVNAITPMRGGRTITLLDLSTQSSGLPRLPNNMRPASGMNPYADYSVEQLYDFLSKYELTRDIGVQYEYSNLGVGLLGHALALRGKKSYEDLMRERILAPLGMKSSGITLSDEQQKRLAPGHNFGGAITPNWDLPVLAGAGALRSSTHDLLRFLAANIDSTQGPVAKRMQLALKPMRPAGPSMQIGLGWHVFTRPDRVLTWHNGGTGGYRSFTGFDQQNRRGVVILTNSALPSDDIGFHLLDPALPLAPAPK